MSNHLLVLLGGALGTLARYRVAVAMHSWIPHYTASATLLVNVVGSLLIGLVLGIPLELRPTSESFRLFFVVGFLGGLTTFSSLAYETVALSSNPNLGFRAGVVHLLANLVLGLGAVVLGAWLARLKWMS